MPECYNLSLGGLSISLIPDRDSGEYEYIKRASDFLSLRSPEITLQIHCGGFQEFRSATVVFETDVAWRMLQDDGRWIINIYPNAQTPHLLGVFPGDFRSGDIYTSQNENIPHRYIFPLVSPMGELYLMNLLGTGLGMLIHASGVIYQGKGYLFTGNASAGKTTIARLWQSLPDVRVINDDKVIVRSEAAGFRIYGTPWHGVGGMALSDSAPLTQVFILKQADQNYVSPLSSAQATGGLLARSFVPLWDSEKIAFILGFLDKLCSTVPCQELGFLPDSSIIDLIRNIG